MNLDQYIRRRVVARPGGPRCALCDAVVDYEAIVEGYPGEEDADGRCTKNADGETCRVLVRHHGQEEIRTIDFGSRSWGPIELSKWMQRIKWFNPLEMVDQGRLAK